MWDKARVRMRWPLKTTMSFLVRYRDTPIYFNYLNRAMLALNPKKDWQDTWVEYVLAGGSGWELYRELIAVGESKKLQARSVCSLPSRKPVRSCNFVSWF